MLIGYLNFHLLLNKITLPYTIWLKNQSIHLEKQLKMQYLSISQTDEKKQEPNCKIGGLVRTSDNRSVFSQSDITNYSCKLNAKTETKNDANPSCRINCLPNRTEENLLISTKLTSDENNQIKTKLNLIEKKTPIINGTNRTPN